MENPALRPTALLAETWATIRAHPLPLLLPLVILGLLAGSGSRDRGMRFDPSTPPLEYLPFFALLGMLALAVIVLLFLAYCYATLMTTKAAFAASQQNRDMDLGEAFRESSPLLVAGIGTFLLWALVVIVGFILLVVPGFIALAGLVPAAAVLVAEGQTGTGALRRAWELTKGHKGKLFGALALLFLANIVVDALVGWIPFLGGPIAGAANGAFLAANLVLGVLAYEHLKRDAPHHAGVVQQAPLP